MKFHLESWQMLLLLVLTFVKSIRLEESSNSIVCARVRKTQNNVECYVDKTAVIDADNFVFSSKLNATEISFDPNWQIAFLPIKVSDIFPLLRIYGASFLLVTHLTESNFVGLSKLEMLYLTGNRIEKLQSGIFAKLKSLKALYLGKLLTQTR